MPYNFHDKFSETKEANFWVTQVCLYVFIIKNNVLHKTESVNGVEREREGEIEWEREYAKNRTRK